MKKATLKKVVSSIFEELLLEKETETEKLLNMKIKNPETKNDIKLKSALGYPEDSKVYKAAKTAYAKGAEILGVSADPKKSAQEPEAEPKKSAQEPEAEPKADASNSDVKKPKIPQNKEEAQKLYIGHVEGDFDRETLTGWSDEFSKNIAKGPLSRASEMWHSAVTGADGGKATEGMDMESAMQVVANSLNSNNLESVAQVITKFVPNKNTYVGDARGYDGKLAQETKDHINKIIDMAGGADKVKQIVQTQQDTARGMIDQMKSGELDLVGDGRAPWDDDEDDDFEASFNKKQAMKDLKRLESDAKKFLSVMDKELGLASSDAERKSAADKKSAEKASIEKSLSDAKKAPAKATKELTIDDAKKLGLGKGYDENGEYVDVASEAYKNLPQDTAQISDNSPQAVYRGKDFNLVDAVLGWGDGPDIEEFEPEDQEKANQLVSTAMNSGDFKQIQGFMSDGGPDPEYTNGLKNLVDATGGPDKTKQIAQNHIKSIKDMIKKAESGQLPLHDDPDGDQVYPDNYWDEDKQGMPSGKTHQESAIKDLKNCLNDAQRFADSLEEEYPGSEDELAKKKKAKEDKLAAWQNSPERKKLKAAYEAEIQPLKDEQDKLMKTVLALKKQQKENPSDETEEKLKKAREMREKQERVYLKKKEKARDQYSADIQKAYDEFEPPTNEGYIKLRNLIPNF